MRISVELVPRSPAALVRDALFIRERFDWVTMLNIPDLRRFPLRSWEACSATAPIYASSIPHVRAIDVAPHDPLAMLETILAAGLNEVLVVSGDPPHDFGQLAYPQSSVEVIRRFKRECPQLRVYAALDPYRQGIRAECEYVERKLEAGADGFFTQPFFDLRLLEIYAERLAGQVVFWGVTPIVTEGARAYWETTNRIVLPRSFQPTMEWNREFARTVLRFVKLNDANAYLMPIRVDLAEYLDGLM
jgi:methylenetetrahydrofolate reductase (NADPH)